VVNGGVEGDVLVVAHHAINQVTSHHLIRHPAVYELALEVILPPCGLMKISIGAAEQDVTAEVVNWE
jgi:hypothetical protein